MANEVLKAQTAKARLEKMKTDVIDRARARAAWAKTSANRQTRAQKRTS